MRSSTQRGQRGVWPRFGLLLGFASDLSASPQNVKRKHASGAGLVRPDTKLFGLRSDRFSASKRPQHKPERSPNRQQACNKAASSKGHACKIERHSRLKTVQSRTRDVPIRHPRGMIGAHERTCALHDGQVSVEPRMSLKRSHHIGLPPFDKIGATHLRQCRIAAQPFGLGRGVEIRNNLCQSINRAPQTLGVLLRIFRKLRGRRPAQQPPDQGQAAHDHWSAT
mmetsp:Transcript_23351/g.40715  ORF Transcript_23351/g.40715 Transcript_23351/m.40715 type:complete len:224 (-) Transcript_23351:2308-2979(-)